MDSLRAAIRCICVSWSPLSNMATLWLTTGNCSRVTLPDAHRRRYRVGEEHGVNPLHDVARDFEKVPFVFQLVEHQPTWS